MVFYKSWYYHIDTHSTFQRSLHICVTRYNASCKNVDTDLPQKLMFYIKEIMGICNLHKKCYTDIKIYFNLAKVDCYEVC